MFIRILVAGLLFAGTLCSANAAIVGCNVPKSQTASTNEKILQLQEIDEQVVALQKRTPDDRLAAETCGPKGMPLLENRLALALDIYRSLPALKCPASVVAEYKDHVAYAKATLAACASFVKKSEAAKERCQPGATVETMSEGDRNPTSYQVVVIRNDCPARVSFEYTISTISTNKSQKLFTACAPAKTARFVAAGSRTSSTQDQRLTVGGPKECK